MMAGLNYQAETRVTLPLAVPRRSVSRIAATRPGPGSSSSVIIVISAVKLSPPGCWLHLSFRGHHVKSQVDPTDLGATTAVARNLLQD